MKYPTKIDLIETNKYHVIKDFWLTEEQLETIINSIFLNKDIWRLISTRQKLSENFINKYWDELDIPCILKHQKINEKFIYEHEEQLKYKFHWDAISMHVSKKFSEDFFIKFHDRLNIEFLNYRKIISDDLYLKLIIMKKLVE